MTTTALLIDTLAAEIRPVKPGDGIDGLILGVAGGGLVALAGVVAVFGVQPGLGGAALPAMLMKDAYALGIATLALSGALLLGRPGASRPRALMLLLPVAALALAAAGALARTPAEGVPALLLGGSWRQCPLRIALLSLPIFAGVVIALRRRAPTRLRQAGAAAGLLAGSVAAALYALACGESSPAFVLIWYSAGIALSTALGALVGPRVLRW